MQREVVERCEIMYRASFYPYALREISVLTELALGHLLLMLAYNRTVAELPSLFTVYCIPSDVPLMSRDEQQAGHKQGAFGPLYIWGSKKNRYYGQTKRGVLP